MDIAVPPPSPEGSGAPLVPPPLPPAPRILPVTSKVRLYVVALKLAATELTLLDPHVPVTNRNLLIFLFRLPFHAKSSISKFVFVDD
jgi:hypothetical protein